MEPLIVTGPNGSDDYFTGDLDAGLAAAGIDQYVMLYQQDGVHICVTSSHAGVALADDPMQYANEWGTGFTPEEAARYCLGAAFGPVDEHFDEAALRGLLNEQAEVEA